MRYLVTGGAGFIGSNIVDELVRRGHQVVVLDDLSSGKEANLAGVREQNRLARGQHHGSGGAAARMPRRRLRDSPGGPNLRAQIRARTRIESNRVNIDGTLNVLVAARDAKVRRFVFAASSSAYGETPTLPKVETMQPQPISPYGVTKYVGELYAQVFGRVYGLENACLRYFNVFGPRQDPTSQYSGVLSRFMLAIIKGEPPVVYGDGEQTRDFTYIENVVDETLRACEASRSFRIKCSTAGRGANHPQRSVEAAREDHRARRFRPKYDPPRNGDIRDSQADISLARKVLGYEPRVQFRGRARRTWEWYKSPTRNT